MLSSIYCKQSNSLFEAFSHAVVVSQHATGKQDVFPGGIYPGESVCPGGDVCLPKIATEAGSTHPTGMHSCFTFCRFLVV